MSPFRPLSLATCTAALLLAGFGDPQPAHAADPVRLKPWGFFAEVYGGGHFFLQDAEDFEHSGVLGGTVGFKFLPHFGIEMGMGWVQTATRWRPEGVAYGRRVDLLNPRIDAVFWLGKGPVVPYVQVGALLKWWRIAHCSPQELYQRKAEDTDFELDLGVGARFLFAHWVGLDLNAHYFMSTGGEQVDTTSAQVVSDRFDNVELTGGLFVLLGGGPKDRDGDGLVDRRDVCPDDPEDRDGFEDEDGCPDRDNDQDGILDTTDRCPLAPEDKDAFEDADGCPDPDNDKDGIQDAGDRCPLQPEDADGFEDADGCPDPDNDKDGVLDTNDKCVMEPETRNGFQDDDGCPDEIPKEVLRFSGVIQGIHFEVDSDVITRGSYSILDEAAATLAKFPSVRVEIQGHASQDGDDAHNMELSQRRAESVMRYLIHRDIDPSRLVAKGYGESVPIHPDTPADRPKNRRVEFHILTQ